jgi:hypothetical protein
MEEAEIEEGRELLDTLIGFTAMGLVLAKFI